MEKTSPSSSKTPFIVVTVVILLALAGIITYRLTSMPKAGSGQSATENQANVVDLVMKLVNVGAPIKQEEIPVVAMIKDVNALKQANPTFYKDASDGDLVYIWSDRVVLFSERQNKVLQYVPLIPEPGQQVNPNNIPPLFTPGASIEAEGAKIEIRNASGNANAGKDLAAALRAQKMTVTVKEVSKKEPKTLVMPTINKPMGMTLQALGQVLKGDLLPPVDTYAPFEGDIVIILGENK